MKRISVIIPLYNGEPFLARCLRSVLDQTYRDLEVLVIDDGSTDRGAALCREFPDPRITLCRQEHRGVSAARNRGLDLATGESVFFLDCDDVIHPLLLEESARQLEDHGVQLTFCPYRRVDGPQLERLAFSPAPERPRWLRTGNGEDWFHGPYLNELSGIGGKLIRRDFIGALRFDEGLANGEDTLFLYHLFCRGPRTARCCAPWYYYRMHPQSAARVPAALRAERSFQVLRQIRDLEEARGRRESALVWERVALRQLETALAARNETGENRLRAIWKEERARPLYSALSRAQRLRLAACLAGAGPYRVTRKLLRLCSKWIRRLAPDPGPGGTGILTFHCSDNFGAMLQAYGLKTYLLEQGIPAEIVPYAPPFMTGRHWLIPYSPGTWKRGLRAGAAQLVRGAQANLRQGKDFFKRRAAMRRFRETYLTGGDVLRTCLRFHHLAYSCYLLGSDQIWNPEITAGLRRAYFGAFETPWKRRVVAYAASLGGEALPAEYGGTFSQLLRHVDAVSVREEEALPYVRQRYEGPVTAAVDPVLLLDRADWLLAEQPPEREDYILVYLTEQNPDLVAFVTDLSRRTGLPVLEVGSKTLAPGSGFQADFTAGPAEFLGYLHQADYVISNSFHAAAFSILYQKRFLAFPHSRFGARLQTLLRAHGLEDRLAVPGGAADIDAPVDWEAVLRRTRESARWSGDFLRQNIPAPAAGGDAGEWEASE